MTHRKRGRLWRALSDLKWQLIYRIDDVRMHFAKRKRTRQRPAIEHLPPIPGNGVIEIGRPEVDVCMLCSHRDLDMGIAASWSLLRYAPNWQLVVFNDGTLSPDDVQKWQVVIPSARFVHKEEAATIVDRQLGELPLLRMLWARNVYGPQLIDAHLTAGGPSVLLLDSDVLCFQKPVELMARLFNQPHCISWNGDLISAYCADRIKLEAALECTLPDRLNAGLLKTPRFTSANYQALELVLQRIGAVMNEPNWIGHPLLVQTCYAAICASFPGSSILPSDYAVCTRHSKPSVMCHYTSPPGIRARFFNEGIRELLRQA